MANAGMGARRTWEQRMVECQTYYTLARQAGKCKHCEATNVYLKFGGVGRPVKLYGPDLNRLKLAIQEDGWVCQKCGLKHKALISPPVVVLKPWAPYPKDPWVLKQLEIMRTGSDRMGIRTPRAIEAFLKQQGWVSEEDWYKEREAPTLEQSEALALQELGITPPPPPTNDRILENGGD